MLEACEMHGMSLCPSRSDACLPSGLTYLDIVPEVNQVLTDGDLGFRVTRKEHILLALGIENAPQLAIILELLYVRDHEMTCETDVQCLRA